jgi:hypothetical protein
MLGSPVSPRKAFFAITKRNVEWCGNYSV